MSDTDMDGRSAAGKRRAGRRVIDSERSSDEDCADDGKSGKLSKSSTYCDALAYEACSREEYLQLRRECDELLKKLDREDAVLETCREEVGALRGRILEHLATDAARLKELTDREAQGRTVHRVKTDKVPIKLPLGSDVLKLTTEIEEALLSKDIHLHALIQRGLKTAVREMEKGTLDDKDKKRLIEYKVHAKETGDKVAEMTKKLYKMQDDRLLPVKDNRASTSATGNSNVANVENASATVTRRSRSETATSRVINDSDETDSEEELVDLGSDWYLSGEDDDNESEDLEDVDDYFYGFGNDDTTSERVDDDGDEDDVPLKVIDSDDKMTLEQHSRGKKRVNATSRDDEDNDLSSDGGFSNTGSLRKRKRCCNKRKASPKSDVQYEDSSSCDTPDTSLARQKLRKFLRAKKK